MAVRHAPVQTRCHGKGSLAGLTGISLLSDFYPANMKLQFLEQRTAEYRIMNIECRRVESLRSVFY